MRAVAAEAGTTTRAVHSLFGSKEGLLIDALAESAFDFLTDNIALDVTGDPSTILWRSGFRSSAR